MEQGSVLYLNGDYFQALQSFDKADALAEKLYTTSVSKTAAAQVVGDGVADYKGAAYERALLKFYQSMAHYMLAQKGEYEAYTPTEKEAEPVAARTLSEAEIKKHVSGAKSVLLAWNALASDPGMQNRPTPEALEKAWGAYLNQSGSDVERNRSALLYKAWEKMLDDAESVLTAEQKKTVRAYIRERKRNGASENVAVVLKTGLIAPKKAEKVGFPIVSRDFNAATMAKLLGNKDGLFFFEYASMDKPVPAEDYKLVIKKDGKEVTERQMALVAPLSEIAYRDFQMNRKALTAKKGARLTVKYTAALAAAKAAYDKAPSMKDYAASGAFATAVKAIEAYEYADLRAWSSLPANIFMQSLKLGDGTYTAEIVRNEKTLYSHTFTVGKGAPVLLDFNLPAEK